MAWFLPPSSPDACRASNSASKHSARRPLTLGDGGGGLRPTDGAPSGRHPRPAGRPPRLRLTLSAAGGQADLAVPMDLKGTVG
ncbi:hypothetical protein ACP4OV_012759 [Aristida adscensionis]